MKVLIAEDDPVSLRMLESMIEKWGFNPVTSRDGSEAWEKFQSDSEIQLVISDWMMPEIDGLELCRKIRSLSVRRYSYIILLTAKTQIDDVVTGIEAGADDFVSKPFNRHELRARINSGTRVVQLENELGSKVEELSKAYDQMRVDLEAAGALQRSMLPDKNIEYPGIRYAWNFIPWEQIGGDLFNLVQLDKSRLGIYILDVAGHGVSAALLTVALGRMLSPYDIQASLLYSENEGEKMKIVEPGLVAKSLNSRFQFATSRGDFITFFYGIFNRDSMTFHYSRAGHPCPIHISRRKSKHFADDGGIPIGIIPDYSYNDYTISVEKGDRLYFFTDGLFEASNPDGERFGEDRMIKYLASVSGSSLQETVDGMTAGITDWLGGHDSSDDMTFIGIEII